MKDCSEVSVSAYSALTSTESEGVAQVCLPFPSKKKKNSPLLIPPQHTHTYFGILSSFLPFSVSNSRKAWNIFKALKVLGQQFTQNSECGTRRPFCRAAPRRGCLIKFLNTWTSHECLIFFCTTQRESKVLFRRGAKLHPQVAG